MTDHTLIQFRLEWARNNQPLVNRDGHNVEYVIDNTNVGMGNTRVVFYDHVMQDYYSTDEEGRASSLLTNTPHPLDVFCKPVPVVLYAYPSAPEVWHKWDAGEITSLKHARHEATCLKAKGFATQIVLVLE